MSKNTLANEIKKNKKQQIQNEAHTAHSQLPHLKALNACHQNKLYELAHFLSSSSCTFAMLEGAFVTTVSIFLSRLVSFFTAAFVLHFPILLTVAHTYVTDHVALHPLPEILSFGGCNSGLISISFRRNPLVSLHWVNEIPSYSPRTVPI